MIEISKAAIAEIKRMQKVRAQPQSNFRVGLAAGGCKDFYYTIDLSAATELPSETETKDLNQDLCYEVNGVSILVDRQQLKYLERLKLDYSEDLMGGGFRFQNPQATSVCGCGNSFSVANIEVERWQLPT